MNLLKYAAFQDDRRYEPPLAIVESRMRPENAAFDSSHEIAERFINPFEA